MVNATRSYVKKSVLLAVGSALVLALTITDSGTAGLFLTIRNLLDQGSCPGFVLSNEGLKQKFGLENYDDRVVLVINTFGHKTNHVGGFGFELGLTSRPCVLDDVYLYWRYPSDYGKYMLHDSSFEKDDLMVRLLTEPSKSESGSRNAEIYGFWKPLLIKYHLDSVPDGTFVVYADMHLQDTLPWVPYLLEAMDKRGADLSLLEHEHGSVGAGEEHVQHERFHGGAGYIFLRKNSSTQELISNWAKDVTKRFETRLRESHSKDDKNSFDQQDLLSVAVENTYGEAANKMEYQISLDGWTVQTYGLNSISKLSQPISPLQVN